MLRPLPLALEAAIATMCPWPTATDDQVAEPTRTGIVTGPVAVPWASWPSELTPQHHSVPSTRTAQVDSNFETTVRTLTGSATSVATAVDAGTAPIPSCPIELSPQHQSVPLSRTAQVCDAPAVTVSQSAVGSTRAGTRDETKLPRPS